MADDLITSTVRGVLAVDAAVVADHPLVDGNERTALATAAVCDDANGDAFEYDESVRTVLERLGIDADAVDLGAPVTDLRS
jgi:hypothetical protein